jgi:hypothetical protein
VTAGSLYRRLLGPHFDRLPQALRRFHDTNGASATGILHVRHGARRSARAVARMLRLPPKGDRIPVTLRVTSEGDGREAWYRAFGSHELRTIQWAEHGRLLERAGAVTFAFDVAADEHGLRFRSVGLTCLGIAVPRRLALEVDADVRGFDTHWNVTVVVRAPRVGVITSYEGRITPASQ